MDARGKRIANVTPKSSVNPKCKLKGDFVSFLCGKCVLVISAWQCKRECMVWTITNNDSSHPHQKTWNKEMTMIDGSWLFTDFSRRAFLGTVKSSGDAVPCLSCAQHAEDWPSHACCPTAQSGPLNWEAASFLHGPSNWAKLIWMGRLPIQMRGWLLWKLSRAMLHSAEILSRKLLWQYTQRDKRMMFSSMLIFIILSKTVALSKNS